MSEQDKLDLIGKLYEMEALMDELEALGRRPRGPASMCECCEVNTAEPDDFLCMECISKQTLALD